MIFLAPLPVPESEDTPKIVKQCQHSKISQYAGRLCCQKLQVFCFFAGLSKLQRFIVIFRVSPPILYKTASRPVTTHFLELYPSRIRFTDFSRSGDLIPVGLCPALSCRQIQFGRCRYWYCTFKTFTYMLSALILLPLSVPVPHVPHTTQHLYY